MTGPRMERRHSFALILTMFLVVLLATTGVGLALTAATESVMAGWTARDLDHRLAVDSLLACLPELRKARSLESSSDTDAGGVQRLNLTLGDCELECRIRLESGKVALGEAWSVNESTARLRELARVHGLAEHDIRPLPILRQQDDPELPSFVWFDQLIRPTEIEEIFRWSFPTSEGAEYLGVVERPAWSDLITFWGVEGGSVVAIEIETRIGTDARRWYVVAAMAGDAVRVLYRGAI